eukprot:s1393_g1.t1
MISFHLYLLLSFKPFLQFIAAVESRMDLRWALVDDQFPPLPAAEFQALLAIHRRRGIQNGPPDLPDECLRIASRAMIFSSGAILDRARDAFNSGFEAKIALVTGNPFLKDPMASTDKHRHWVCLYRRTPDYNKRLSTKKCLDIALAIEEDAGTLGQSLVIGSVVALVLVWYAKHTSTFDSRAKSWPLAEFIAELYKGDGSEGTAVSAVVDLAFSLLVTLFSREDALFLYLTWVDIEEGTELWHSMEEFDTLGVSYFGNRHTKMPMDVEIEGPYWQDVFRLLGQVQLWPCLR